MKIFIYIACFFVMIIIQVVIKNAGVMLGVVPAVLLYLVTLWTASGLCKLWDNRENK